MDATNASSGERRADSPNDSLLTPDVDARAQATPIDPTAPVPALGRTGRAVASARGRSVGVTVLAVLGVFYTLYFARDFFLPIAFALLLDFFFSPLVRALARLRIRPPLGAGLVVLSLVGAVGATAYGLSGPVQGWAARAPTTFTTAREKLRTLLGPLEDMSRTAEQVERAASVTGAPATAEVVVRGPSLVSRLFGTTQRLVGAVLQVLLLLYFLLAAGDLFLQKLIKLLPNVEDKQAALQIARKTEASISTYLLTTAAVNAVEAVVVGLAMRLLGMPNPVLWGVVVFVLEFIPYIGPAVITLVLGLAALTTFDGVGRALAVPAIYQAINLVQSNVVSPWLLSQRLTLNPVALFVGLSFWWTLWGIPGAFIAVPLLATFKIACDHIASLASIGEFLGQRDVRERRTSVRGA